MGTVKTAASTSDTKENLFGFKPGGNRLRETLVLFAWLVFVFGGPLLALKAVNHYPFLDERVFIASLLAVVVLFPFSFLVLKEDSLGTNLPRWAKVVARFGFTLLFAFLCFGVLGIANGYSSRTEIRVVQCVGKRISTSNPPEYILRLLPWPGSYRISEVTASPDVFATARTGSSVQLEVGKGNLGLEWVKVSSSLRIR